MPEPTQKFPISAQPAGFGVIRDGSIEAVEAEDLVRDLVKPHEGIAHICLKTIGFVNTDYRDLRLRRGLRRQAKGDWLSSCGGRVVRQSRGSGRGQK